VLESQGAKTVAHTEVGDEGIDVGDLAGDIRRCCETRCDVLWSFDAGVPRIGFDVICRRSTPAVRSVSCRSRVEREYLRCRESGDAGCDMEKDEMKVSLSMECKLGANGDGCGVQLCRCLMSFSYKRVRGTRQVAVKHVGITKRREVRLRRRLLEEFR
jgi:hypothetical protein